MQDTESPQAVAAIFGIWLVLSAGRAENTPRAIVY